MKKNTVFFTLFLPAALLSGLLTTAFVPEKKDPLKNRIPFFETFSDEMTFREFRAEDNFPLNPGDVFALDGKKNCAESEFFSGMIGKNGFFQLEEGNKVFLKGLTIAEAEKSIGEKIRRDVFLRPLELTIQTITGGLEDE